MKRYLSYAVTALFATTIMAFASPDTDALEAKEKAAWQAFKDKKSDDFKKLMSPQMMAVYADGVYDLQKEVDGMAKIDMKSFSISDFKVVMPDANTAVLTYKVKMEATMGSENQSGDYHVGSVWTKQNGEWRGVFHTDVKAEEGGGSAAAKK